MAILHQLLRPAGIVLMAALVVLLTGDGASASAGTVPGRMAQMRQAGCCCRTVPAGCCCCEPAAVAPAMDSAGPARPTGQAVLIHGGNQSFRPSGACQCRSQMPLVPSVDPNRITGETHRGLRAVSPTVESPQDAHWIAVPNAGRPPSGLEACPLYLSLSRLVI
jgi:hypothetical protein